jgi:MOSC domain-containing protein YiiM
VIPRHFPLLGGTGVIVKSLQVGRVAGREYQGTTVPTAFFKDPVTGPRFLSKLGITGDEQADMVHHGGPDKAALVYAVEHYPFWAEFLGREPGPAALGENLTVQGLTEETACIGDSYRIGGAVVQVSQPRIPCFKNNIRHGRTEMLDKVMESMLTGFYVRVFAEGEVQAGDSITLLSRPANAPTVMWANQMLYREQANQDGARRLLAAEGLAEVWCKLMRKRLGQS